MARTVGEIFSRSGVLARILSLIILSALLSQITNPASGAEPEVQPASDQRSEVVPASLAAWYPEPHPILTDARVRKAMAYCTNKLALIDSVHPLSSASEKQSLMMNDPAASANAHLGDNLALTQAERLSFYAIAQERFASEVPSIPLFEYYGAPGSWEHIDFNMTSLPQLYLPITRK